MFIIQLRDQQFNVQDTDEVVGWVGMILRDDTWVRGKVSRRECAEIYATRSHANQTLNRLSDAFLDRYNATIVMVSQE